MKTSITNEGVTGRLTVKLSSCANPDHGERTAPSKKENTQCKTLADARTACMVYIQRHDLGGGNWNGGDVMDHAKKFIARVSYNGRVWDANDKEITGAALLKNY